MGKCRNCGGKFEFCLKVSDEGGGFFSDCAVYRCSSCGTEDTSNEMADFPDNNDGSGEDGYLGSGEGDGDSGMI